jgi:hypothetical protein
MTHDLELAQRFLRGTFMVLWLSLGFVLLFGGIQALVAWSSHSGSSHVAVLAGAEVVGASLFLIPRSLRIGGALLVVVLLAAAGVHIFEGEPSGALVVYASAALFVTAHGPARR